MTKYTVDCRGVRDFAGFVAAMNDGLVKRFGGDWNGNLDALNDYLSWPKEPYLLEMENSEAMPIVLGYLSTADWYREIFKTCQVGHREDVARYIAQSEAGRGETLWNMILEIFAENAQFVTLRFGHTSN
jgi:hypothetical protein